MKNAGFTLLELSIVIVIIGLIVAGISAGQSLVRQASLRNVVSDINELKVAVNSFALQYDAVPGDMSNASSYWTTSDGDGNGMLVADSSDMTENLLFWQHLALAGLVEGSYVSTDQGSPNSVPGVNVPVAPLSGAGYYASRSYDGAGIFGILQGNSISLTYQTSLNYFGRVVTPAEASSIDEKMDDGFPALGMVYSDTAACGVGGCSPACTSQGRTFAGDYSTVTYVFSTTNGNCRMWFWLDKS